MKPSQITIQQSKDIIVAFLFSDITLNKIDKVVEIDHFYTKSVKNSGNMFIKQLDNAIMNRFDNKDVLNQFIQVKKLFREKLDEVVEIHGQEILKILEL